MVLSSSLFPNQFGNDTLKDVSPPRTRRRDISCRQLLLFLSLLVNATVASGSRKKRANVFLLGVMGFAAAAAEPTWYVRRYNLPINMEPLE